MLLFVSNYYGGSKKIQRGYARSHSQASSTQEEGDEGSLNAEDTSTTTQDAALLGLQPALQLNNAIQDHDAANTSATHG